MMRAIFVTSGAATLVIAFFSLAVNRGHPQFYTHMAVHISVVAVAAPLLALGIGRSPWDRIPAGASLVSSPLLASLVELIVVWVWHTPALHELARHSGVALAAEQASFLGAGLFLWVTVLSGKQASRRGEGIVALLLTAIHMTLLGALLALSSRPFYSHLAESHELSALDDQHLGGAIMILVGGISYLLGGLWLSWRLLSYRKP